MKIIRKALYSLLIVGCTLLLAACFNPYQGEETGTITINLGGGSTARAGWGDMVGGPGLPLTYRLFIYDESIIGHDGNEISINSSGIANVNVQPGEYRIEVGAYVNGWDYAIGSHGPFTIAAGGKEDATITMQMIPNAIVFSVKKGEPLIFTPYEAASGAPMPSHDITIYNFTSDTGSEAVTLSAGSSFSLSTLSTTIAGDNSSPVITVTASPTTTGEYNEVLTLSWGGSYSATVDLNFVVYPASGSTIMDEIAFNTIRLNLGGYYILGADINLSSFSNWTPIGTSGAPFTGTLDGAGNTITGLTITNAASNNQGLFGVIGGSGEVKNLGFIGVNIKTDYNDRVNIGGIAGINHGTIQNCYVTGTLNPKETPPAYPRGTNIAAIAGYNYGIVKNCYSTANVTSRFAPNDPNNNPCAGGIVGKNDGTVENCFATGTITSEPNGTPMKQIFGGGIVGTHNSCTVSNCVALNNSILGGTGGFYNLYRVVGFGTGLTNNYGLENMSIGDPPTANGGSDKTATGRGGADVSATDAANPSWWGLPAGSGPGWTINSPGTGSETDPWEWNSGVTPQRPKLWFE